MQINSAPVYVNITQNLVKIPVSVGSWKTKAIIDTGSRINIISEACLKDLQHEIVNVPLPSIHSIEGRVFQPKFCVNIVLTVHNTTHVIQAFVIATTAFDLLLGLSACTLFQLMIDLRFPVVKCIQEKLVKAVVVKSVIIPALSSQWVNISARVPSNELLFEKNSNFEYK